MTLASLLLTGNEHGTTTSTENVDGGLDALFRSNPAPPVAVPTRGKPITIPSNPHVHSPTRGHKRKRDQEVHKSQLERPTTSSLLSTSKVKGSKKIKVTSVEHEDSEDEDDEEENSALEEAYLTRHTVPANVDEDASSEDEDVENTEPPQHETHSSTPKKRVKSLKKEKYVPPGETTAERDARTIFVGNIAVDVAKSKPSQKQLKKHFTSRIAGAKVESLRIRSVAFATATAVLPDESGKVPHKDDVSTKQQRQKERAATWRQTDGDTSDREDQGPVKKPSFLTPAEKKRIAFIKADFHKEVDTVNAYVVFAHPAPDDKTDLLPPIEAARVAVAQCDGSIFMDRTLRVDRVGQWRAASGEDAHVGMDDPRATLFVGNLDFAAREEDLRVWFEGVVGQARGPRGVADADEEEGKWVQRVRIIRDRDTQLGKGFAYVRFADRECVDEVLALERSSLKFAKRTLRVQRCKVVPPGGSSAVKHKASVRAPAAQKPASRIKTAPVSVPAGDPLLGTKLAGLSKEDRKVAKAANVDRVQRRLAKKKARAGVELELQKRGGKVRDRERKKGGKPGTSAPVKKGRIRSEKNTEKRNMKK